MSRLLTGIAPDAERQRYTELLLIATLTALVVLLYSQSFTSMAAIWQSSEYRHGALVFPVSAYLLWRARGRLAGAELQPCAWGIMVLLPLVLLWSVARAIGVQFAEHLAVLLLIPATVLTFLGWPLVQRALFPLLFLITAVPVGDALVPHLMEITADVSTTLLRAVGVPVHRQGQLLSLPGGNFEVAEVCAGLGFLTAGTLIAILFAYLTYQSNLKRSVFVAATALAMIVANGVRAFTVMWVASASDMRYLAGRDHVYFGWLLFAIVIVAMTYAGAQFTDRRPDQSISEPVHKRRSRWPLVLAFGFVMLAATAQPLREGWENTWLLLWPAAGLLLWALYRFELRPSDVARAVAAGSGYRRLSGGLALSAAAAVLTAGPFLLAVRDSAVPNEFPSATLELPVIHHCSPPGNWTADWYPALQSPHSVAAGTYFCAGKPVNVFVAAYRDNRQGRELISHANRLLPDEWRPFTVKGEYHFTTQGETIDVNEAQLAAPGRPSSLVWYWYKVGGNAVTTPTAVKLLQAVQLIVRGRADGSVYLLSTPMDESLEASRSRLSQAGRLNSLLADMDGEPEGK